jgi:hypothetical protein
MSSTAKSAPAWREPLRKILELEASRSYDNRAVTGGLDRFVQRWSGDMASFLAEAAPGLVQELVQTPYASLSAGGRARWAARWLAALEEVREPAGGESPPNPPFTKGGEGGFLPREGLMSSIGVKGGSSPPCDRKLRRGHGPR